nr:cation diffusion facilitator family transporter [Pseudomonadota bacterium]
MQVRTLLRLSVATAIAAIAMKSLGWWLTGSVGLLSDAMESFVNLASALFSLAMVTIAERPADADHPFGHSKAEYFASGFEGLLIAGAAIAIIWAASLRFMNLQPLHGLGIGLALIVGSSALNGALAWKMMAASREHRSVALEADARHLYADVWTSAGVVVGLVLVWSSFRTRARQERHGLETEPYILFATKNLLLFGGILALTWLIASYRGLPNVLVIMAVLIAAYAFVTS